MATGFALRDDFDAAKLRRLARVSEDANQGRRPLALAQIYDGGSRRSAAQLGSVGRQIVRDWAVRFNERGPDGLLDGKAPGNKSKLSVAQRQALAAIVDRGPDVAVLGSSAGGGSIWWCAYPYCCGIFLIADRIFDAFGGMKKSAAAKTPPTTYGPHWPFDSTPDETNVIEFDPKRFK